MYHSLSRGSPYSSLPRERGPLTPRGAVVVAIEPGGALKISRPLLTRGERERKRKFKKCVSLSQSVRSSASSSVARAAYLVGIQVGISLGSPQRHMLCIA